jgi:hypothetical protein
MTASAASRPKTGSPGSSATACFRPQHPPVTLVGPGGDALTRQPGDEQRPSLPGQGRQFFPVTEPEARRFRVLGRPRQRARQPRAELDQLVRQNLPPGSAQPAEHLRDARQQAGVAF